MSLGLLMVSPIPYHSFKNVRFGQSYSATVIPVIVSILLILEPGLNFFLVGVAYVGSGPAGYAWRWRTGRALEPAAYEEASPGADGSAASPKLTPKLTSLATHLGAAEKREGRGHHEQ